MVIGLDRIKKVHIRNTVEVEAFSEVKESALVVDVGNKAARQEKTVRIQRRRKDE